MMQEAYDEIMLNMVMANLRRLFGKRDTIYSKNSISMMMMMMGKNHLNIRLSDDVAMNIPYKNILRVEMSYSAERDYGVIIINTKAYYAYSMRVDKSVFDKEI